MNDSEEDQRQHSPSEDGTGPAATPAAAEDWPPARPRRRPFWVMPLAGLAMLGLGAGAAYLVSNLTAPPRPAAVATPPAETEPATTPPESPAPATPAAVETAPATVEAAPPAAPAPEPATVTPPVPAAQQQANITTESIEDWLLVCPTTGEARCLIQQQLRSSESNAIVVSWSIQRDAQGVVSAVWRTPTGLLLAQGLVLDAGDGNPRVVPFSSCDPSGCVARAVLAQDYLATLGSAAAISGTVVAASSNQPVRFPFSSRGLTTALARLGTQ